MISFPDFAECISDGETVDEAIDNGRDALKATIAALKSKKLPVPAPNSGGVASGKFVARVPKTVHAQLATRARGRRCVAQCAGAHLYCSGLGCKWQQGPRAGCGLSPRVGCWDHGMASTQLPYCSSNQNSRYRPQTLRKQLFI